MNYTTALNIVLDLAMQNVAPYDLPEVRKEQLAAIALVREQQDTKPVSKEPVTPPDVMMELHQFKYMVKPGSGRVIQHLKTKGVSVTLGENDPMIPKVHAAFARKMQLPTKPFNNQQYVRVFSRVLNYETGAVVSHTGITKLFD